MIDATKLKSAMEKNTIAALKNLDELRAELENINDELHWLENSPIPLADAMINIGGFIKNNTSSEGIEHFFYNRSVAGKQIFDAKVNLNEEVRVREGYIIGANGLADLSIMLCSLLGSSIQPILEDMAKNAAKEIKSGPPLAERSQLKIDLLKKKHAVEVEEEQLICSAEELGLYGFYRREDCNPEIVLMTTEA
jgi:hypothetical protein